MKLLDFLKKNWVGGLIGVISTVLLSFIGIPFLALPAAMIVTGVSGEVTTNAQIYTGMALYVIQNILIGAWVQSRFFKKKRGRK